jgi:NTP pyrophosphatase (non-canonical NTP hydrolase)
MVNDTFSNKYLRVTISQVVDWARDRNLIEGATSKDQFHKLIQECGELSDNLCKGKSVIDDIGDVMVVLIIIAEQQGLSIQECLGHAYNDIKDRKGRMVDGVFVKEADSLPEGTTHMSPDNRPHKLSGGFWKVFVDDGWRVVSGTPTGLRKV